MFIFVKMSSKWYGREVEMDGDGINEDEIENMTTHALGGNIVVIADDLEWFAEELGIDLKEIELIEE